VPRAQKDALGCEDSARGKHCANHVYEFCVAKIFNVDDVSQIRVQK
jgi:hypothetical protein